MLQLVVEHVSAIHKFDDSLSCSCTAAAATAIPHSAYLWIPGWSERIEPMREKFIFLHCLWIDCVGQDLV